MLAEKAVRVWKRFTDRQIYYDQRVLPGEESGEKHQSQTGAIVGSSRHRFSLRIESQLSTQEKSFGPQDLSGSETQEQESNALPNQHKRNG